MVDEYVTVTAKLIDTASPASKKMANNIVKDMDKVVDSTKKMSGGFDMASLSLLFFGMQMKRFSEGIIRSTTDTFNKISQGSSAAGQAITSLSANWTFLKFEIGRALGEALIPLLPILIKIFGVMSNFAQRHPKGLAALILGTFAVGTLAFIIGSIGTLISGLTGVTITQAVTNATALGTALGTLAKIGFLVIGVSFAIASLSDMSEGKWAEAIANALIAGGGFYALKAPGAGGALVAIGLTMQLVGLDEVQKQATVFFAGMMRLIGGIIKYTVGIAGLGLEVLMNSAIAWMNKILSKIGMGTISSVSFGTDAIKSIDNLIGGAEDSLINKGLLPNNGQWGSGGGGGGSQSVKVDISVNQEGKVTNVARKTGSTTSRTRLPNGAIAMSYSGRGETS